MSDSPIALIGGDRRRYSPSVTSFIFRTAAEENKDIKRVDFLVVRVYEQATQ